MTLKQVDDIDLVEPHLTQPCAELTPNLLRRGYPFPLGVILLLGDLRCAIFDTSL